MWVIWDTDTGEEMDRVEYLDEAYTLIFKLNGESDYDHFDKRWEE